MATKKKTEVKDTRLARSESDKVIGGVCGGLGEFFNIDASLVRLIFVLITLFGGSGILLYLVLWLVIPPQSQKGDISKQSIKKGADEMKDKAERFAEDAKEFSKTQGSKRLFGIIILVLGVLFLLDNFQVFRFFNFARFWPVILIILGYMILTRKNE